MSLKYTNHCNIDVAGRKEHLTMTVRKISANLATGLLAFVLVSGLSSPAYSIENSAVSNVSSSNEQTQIKVETQVIDGKKYTIKWNTQDDSINIFDAAGKIVGSTTMSEVKAKYTEVAPSSASGSQVALAGANACSVTPGAAGIANSVLWAAAGLTAVAPPAAIAAAAGGVVTGGIIGVGSMFC